MFFCSKIEGTILASFADEVHSSAEVTAFFQMSLCSCDQLFLLLKWLIGKHLETNGSHREIHYIICQRRNWGINCYK